MPKKALKKSLKFLTLASLVCLIVFLVSAATGPDQSLYFSRSVPSELEPNRLGRYLAAPTRWPNWFFSLREVKIMNPEALNASQELDETASIGAIIELIMDPGKGKGKVFTLTVQVASYVPQENELTIRVLSDSSGRLTKLFDAMEWKIQIKPNPKGSGSLVMGEAKAHTCHWRSRFFGITAEKIMMNQVFYPHLIKLAELKQPFADVSPKIKPPSASISD
jgi:hypothetical protein